VEGSEYKYELERTIEDISNSQLIKCSLILVILIAQHPQCIVDCT